MLLPEGFELFVILEGDRSILFFISGLPENAQQEAEALIRLIQEKGNSIVGGRRVSHDDGLFELRGEYVRVFYKVSADDRIVLIDGLLPDQGEEHLDKIRRKAELL
jgi:mRNA-degrading endonuclease RelE of RelBE toxin-antitoxin system